MPNPNRERNLRAPWKKGETGNPNGRPAQPWRAWLEAHLPLDCFEKFKQGMNDATVRSRILGEYAVGEDRVFDMDVPDAGDIEVVFQ